MHVVRFYCFFVFKQFFKKNVIVLLSTKARIMHPTLMFFAKKWLTKKSLNSKGVVETVLNTKRVVFGTFTAFGSNIEFLRIAIRGCPEMTSLF